MEKVIKTYAETGYIDEYRLKEQKAVCKKNNFLNYSDCNLA